MCYHYSVLKSRLVVPKYIQEELDVPLFVDNLCFKGLERHGWWLGKRQKWEMEA